MTVFEYDREQLAREFAESINRNSLEGYSDTPDYITAEYLVKMFDLINTTVNNRKHDSSANIVHQLMDGGLTAADVFFGKRGKDETVAMVEGK